MILERLMLSRSGQVQAGDAPYLDHVPIGYQRYRKRSFVTINTPQDDADYQAGYRKVLEVLKLLDDSGIQLLPGTDDGTGFSQPRELEVYVAAGIPAGQDAAARHPGRESATSGATTRSARSSAASWPTSSWSTATRPPTSAASGRTA